VLVTTSRGPNAEMNDVVLIRRVMQRDETALATLYDRYARLVFSVAKRVVGESSAAEEVVQDIFYQLWRTAANFDSARGSLAGWLLVSARNRAIDRLRRRHGTNEELPADTVGFSPNLETAAAQNQLMEQVKKFMTELPVAQRTALELAYFEGLTHTEISQRTGEPLGTIKTRLRSAIESLKKGLRP
jgi:RNA polymerase sigma-70 factor (ECF subfamily)